MHPVRRETTIAVLCGVAAMLCFSSVPVFLRHLTAYLDAWCVNAVRYGTAAVFWFPFVVVLGRRQRLQAARPRRSVWLAALVPAVCNLLGQIGWANSPYYIEASTIGFVIRCSFLFTLVLGLIFIPSERGLVRRRLFLVGAATSIAGVFLMYVERLAAAGAATGDEATGLAIIVGTSIGWAAYAVSVRRFLRGYPLRLAFGVVSLYTAAGLVVLMLLLGDYRQFADVSGREWVLLIGSAMLGITFGHVLYHRGIHGVGPVVASGITLVGPFFTYAVAATVLGETMTPVQLLGGLTVVAGGFALIRARAQADHDEAPQPD